MNAIPALVAGVKEIVAVVPPQGVTDAVLAACALSGVTRIFRVGGAQAMAALAFGTATIPRVDKIVGPGNRFVAEAKRQVVGQVGIDMIAGPTEALIVADGTADPAGSRRPDRPGRARRGRDELVRHHGRATCGRDPGGAGSALEGAPRPPSPVPRWSGTASWSWCRQCGTPSRWRTSGPPSTSRSWAKGRSGSPAAFGTRAPSFWATTARSRSAIIWPARATSFPPGDGALRLTTGRVRLREAEQHHPLFRSASGRRRRRDHRVGGGGRPVRAWRGVRIRVAGGGAARRRDSR